LTTSVLIKMGSALISPDKPPPLPKKQREKSFLTRSNATFIPKTEEHTVQNIYATIHQDQVCVFFHFLSLYI
jgi:hypothetical protein